MVELLPPPAPHVVAFRVGGTLDARAIERVVGAVEDALAEHATVDLYAEVVDLRGATLHAVLKDVVEGLKLLPRLKRFARYAVVTDAAWLKTVAGLEDKLIPGLAIRTFGLAEAEAAQAWVAGGAGG
ncbi:MAG: STAS/SEC14 domain-containing protein [Rubricoccaceae bacterium]|nr:STAS/SEC14 domain-containing protein [Rubricoccaceae bacterium]